MSSKGKHINYKQIIMEAKEKNKINGVKKIIVVASGKGRMSFQLCHELTQ